MQVKTKQTNVAQAGGSETQPISEPVGFIDETELCKRLKISRGTCVNYRKLGLLPFVKLRHRLIFHWPTVEQALLRRHYLLEKTRR